MSENNSRYNRSISKIKETLLRPALTSHYYCKFPIPTPLLSSDNSGVEAFARRNGYDFKFDGDTDEYMSLACCEASLPGFSVLTNEINNDFTGVTERHAYRRVYDDRADFTFYVDEDYTPINFFYLWIDYITDTTQRYAEKTYNYRMRYPNEYQTNQLSIVKFERDMQQSQSFVYYTFYNAFPISMNSIPVSYDSSQLLKCTVSFTYSRYIFESNANPKNIDYFSNPKFGIDNTGELGGQTGFNITRNPLGAGAVDFGVDTNQGQRIPLF